MRDGRERKVASDGLVTEFPGGFFRVKLSDQYLTWRGAAGRAREKNEQIPLFRGFPGPAVAGLAARHAAGKRPS